jgi:hypothetical protein
MGQEGKGTETGQAQEETAKAGSPGGQGNLHPPPLYRDDLPPNIAGFYGGIKGPTGIPFGDNPITHLEQNPVGYPLIVLIIQDYIAAAVWCAGEHQQLIPAFQRRGHTSPDAG